MGPFILREDDGSSQPVYISNIESLERSICHPPCVCADCQNGWYTPEEQRNPAQSYRRRLTDIETERRVCASLAQMRDRLSALSKDLDVFADVILRRWEKRSRAKREELLKHAAPDLAEEQWLLPRYTYSRERMLIHERTERRRRQLLLPWLNVEVLKSNPSVLFALLLYRVAYAPHHWAAFDSAQLTLSWATGHFDIDFSDKCVVMHGPRYGTLVRWEKEAAHRADLLGFPRAILVLEAQAYLMDVLGSIVEHILDGVDRTLPPRNQKWKQLIANAAFRETGVVESWSRYTHQPFSPPPDLNSDYLLSLARTRREATGDHLRYLQCDIPYLRRYMKILFSTEIFKKSSDSQKAVLLASRIHSEIGSHQWWSWIEAECKHVDAMRRMYSDSICRGSPLPQRYDRALGALELLMVNQVIYRAKCLEELLPHVPGMQKHWSLKRGNNGKSPGVIGTLRRITPANTQESLTNDMLDWCLVQMLGQPDNQTMFDHSMLFAMLHEHLAKNPAERHRLDEVVYQVLSDLSTCHEMLMAVRLHRPQNTARTLTETETSEERPAWKWHRSRRGNAQHPGLLRDMGGDLITDLYLAKPPAGPKLVAAARIAQSRALQHSAVEKFWARMRDRIAADFRGSDFSAAEIERLLLVASAHLDSEYLEERKREDEAALPEAINQPDTPQPPASFPGGFESYSRPKSVVPPRSQLTKAGTESEKSLDPNSATLQTVPAHPLNQEAAQLATIQVSKQSLEVLLLMFPGKHNGDSVGGRHVQWDEFVHAMVDAGFTARNSGGSAVAFTSSTSENPSHRSGGGRIVFHKPHPVPKIDPILLRVMGKRMARWFGWRRGLFATSTAPTVDAAAAAAAATIAGSA
ncbi:hypothetical protein BJY01DRAFT_143263 [Aspergillus pseudoustus]|uniref:Uncharacterized protein n=1 Tax=Aspergillus pseudoustus TaxID=1810923 RepID=A0ABR4IGA4_9EURO